MSVRDLPTLNAVLNGTAFLLLLAAFAAIRQKRVNLHRNLIFTALGVSAAFLTSYLIYHSQHGSTPFRGEGATRPLYFTILISHTILAVAIVPLIVVTLRAALRRDFARHRRLARVTFPIWLYVSITGVVIYMMLYRWFAPNGS